MIFLRNFFQKYYPVANRLTQKIESGKRQLSIDYLIKLSNLYQASTDYLLGLTDYPYRLNHKK